MLEVLTSVEQGLPDDGTPTIVTVGTFDGVHRGHWAVFQEICRRAKAQAGRSVLVTFHPHPLRIVRPELAPALLTTPSEKREILAESGLNYAVFLPFTKELQGLSPQEFVEGVLLAKLGMDELVIGYDHGFGRGRSGDVDLLRILGRQRGFAVDVVDPVRVGEAPVSSSAIRKALKAGDVVLAQKGLGRPYGLHGVVVRGEGRGRGLGFPTANLQVPDSDKLIPPPGIYAVWGVLRSGTFMGALHIGPRPTFQGSPPSVELFLLDFERDIYGEELRVDFVEFLRPIEAFESAAALILQMELDVARAREVLSKDDAHQGQDS